MQITLFKGTSIGLGERKLINQGPADRDNKSSDTGFFETAKSDID